MGKHSNRTTHQAGQWRDTVAAILSRVRLSGTEAPLPPALAAPDEWISHDEWAHQHAGKAGAR